jgi:hypothetical protein
VFGGAVRLDAAALQDYKIFTKAMLCAKKEARSSRKSYAFST